MNKILIPVDFSESSLNAFDEAVEIATKLKSDLVLLYVYETSHLASLLDSHKNENFVIIESALKLKLDDLAKKATDVGLNATSVIRKGKPHKEILAHAETIKPRFIIMGAHGDAGYQEKVMGNTPMRVIGESKVPVFTFTLKRERRGFDEIILPLDLTKETTEKVKYAIEIAKAFNSTITVCSVLFKDKGDVKDRLNTQLNAVVERIEKKDLKATAVLLEADILTKAIVDFAESGGDNGVKGDLILIMTQQEKSLGEYFIGSFASKVLNSSKTPVLSVCPRPSATLYQTQSAW